MIRLLWALLPWSSDHEPRCYHDLVIVAPVLPYSCNHSLFAGLSWFPQPYWYFDLIATTAVVIIIGGVWHVLQGQQGA